jgi:hypothetical protein
MRGSVTGTWAVGLERSGQQLGVLPGSGLDVPEPLAEAEGEVGACGAAAQRVTRGGVSPARSARSAAAVMFRSIPPNTTP